MNYGIIQRSKLLDILEDCRLIWGWHRLELPFFNRGNMKKKDLIKLISNHDILRLINLDDLFLRLPKLTMKNISNGKDTTTAFITKILI